MIETSQATDFKAALLADGFTGDLVVATDPEYQASLLRFAKNAQRNAAMVAFVKSAEDVSKVITLVNARSTGPGSIHVAVRGGGHSTSGSSSSEGGIVIDLSRYLNTARVDQERQLGYVGGGANWAAVDKEAIKYGLATTGGTVNHTGVGGLSLGGGLGWLMGEHGMTIDNILQVTLVTSDGSILTVNSTSHPDLYWGIRGGGPNFGCVTEFVFQLYPQRPTVFAGPLVFPPPLLPTVMDAVHEWYAGASEKEAAVVAMTSKGSTGTPLVIAIVFYNGDEEEGRKRFSKLLSLGPIVDGTRMIPYEALNSLQNGTAPYGGNYHLSGTVRGERGIKAETAIQLFDQLVEIASAPGECATDGVPVMAVVWEFFHLKKAASVASDATAYRMRVAHPASPIMIAWQTDGPEATKDAKNRILQLKQRLDEGLKDSFGGGRGKDDTGYGNYEMGNPQATDAAAPLYGENYPRLQELKAKYDPAMMFRSWYPIQPTRVVT
ncbi:hypothetical protein M408DRAFT_205383 [Serendipita vermifera MAFF 305830]|uniref:FAD-binding PCMH-type domain-containing protein n=1 Tax=Serendipita vermifera MAFF 305830 TaxID=933852 RepID=A0A0C2WGX5_SERVB|nr:hypothetical protein M408DRAFT_205383 [Serendipita vermifera MAFF 305830]